MLTNTTIKSIKPKEKPFKKADARGLYLLVTPQGGKRWRFKYRFAMKEKCLSLGVYPDTSLKVARERRDKLRTLLEEGIDPGIERKVQKASIIEKNANNFETVAREWLAKQIPVWSEANTKKITRILEKNVFPYIGATPITDLTAQDLLKFLKRIEKRGAGSVAHRALSDCNRIFRYGVITGKVPNNPCPDLKGALEPLRKGHRAAITEPEKLGQVLRMLDGYRGTPPVSCALRLVPFFFVRPGELRHMKWKEINFEKKEWRYTATKTKTEHIVPLAKQAVEILQEIHPLTGTGVYVFPGLRDSSRPMSDNALLGALRRMGIGTEETCIHGFRATARTILDEVNDFRPDYIEHQLAHAVKDPNGRAYNRTQHLKKRREMMQRWADYLDELKANV